MTGEPTTSVTIPDQLVCKPSPTTRTRSPMLKVGLAGRDESAIFRPHEYKRRVHSSPKSMGWLIQCGESHDWHAFWADPPGQVGRPYRTCRFQSLPDCVKKVNRTMGHKTALMTMRYSHLSVEYKRQAVAKLPTFGTLEGRVPSKSPQREKAKVVGFGKQ